MQDRFKFRAWYYDKDDENDSDNNKMFYNAQDTYDCLCGNPPLRASSFGCIVDDERWTVEQCTGLKDKNGKLIYEGDIILVESNKCPIEWESENARYNVVGYGEIAYLNYNDIEIIGNIHENPELLEVQDV